MPLTFSGLTLTRLPHKGLVTGLLVLAFALGLAFALLQPGPVYGATFAVTTTTDAVDANPGDGLCDSGDGDCTLRAAIQEANATAGADLIKVPAGTYTLTLVNDNDEAEDAGLTGDLDISDDVTIEGAGAEITILNAARLDRYFDAPSVVFPVTITLRNLTIENGVARFGGGIRVSLGDLTIEDSHLTDNTSDANGGGIHISGGGTLIVSGSLISRNAANGNGSGGGIDAGGGVETTITQTTISNNTARLGGGVQVADATLTVSGSLIFRNTASDNGGGLQTFRSEMHVSNSTISGNSAGGSSKGAGVHFGGGTLSTLRYVTITGNTNGYGLSGPYTDGLIESVIIANNPSGDCDDRVVLQSIGANLDSDGSCGVTITADPPQPRRPRR